MSEIDSLQININATATKANDALDNLIKKLDRLTTSLSSIDGSKLNGLASGVSQLGTAMQTMNAVKTSDFTRLAKNLSNLNSLDTSKLSGVSANISKIGTAVSGLSGVSQGVSQITELANGIKQLGYKSADKAIDNIPKLATSMKQLMKELSTAPKVSQNLIDMTNALAKLARTGASSGKAAQSLSNSFTGIYKSSGFAVSGIKKVNARLVSLIRSIAPVVGLVKLIDFGKQAMEISSDLTEVQNVVDVTFGDYKQKIEDLASVSIPELGMSELSVKEIGSRFQAMGTAMGFSTEKMADMSVELTRLTGDMASFYNVEQETMGKALQSIFTGETEPMRKYGIDLTNATIQQYALSQGITTSINKMTQLEKAQLRYNYVMAQTTAAQGDFIRTQDTWANQIRILKENLKQLASIIGGSLINAFKPLVQAINSAMSHIISFAQTVSNALGKIFGWKFEVGGGGVTNDLETGADAADDIASGMGSAADSAKKLKSNLLAIDELNVLNPDTDTSTSGGISGNLGSGSASGGEWVQQDSIFKDFESEIDSLYELGEYIGKVLTDMMNNIDWEAVYEKARNFGTGLADFLNGLISPELFGAVGRTIAGALNTAIYAALSFGETFDWVNLGESIAEGINQFFATFDFKSLADTLNTWAIGILDSAIIALEKTDWEYVGEKIGEFLKEIDFVDIGKKIAFLLWDGIKAGWGMIKGTFNPAPLETAILGLLTIPAIVNFGSKLIGFIVDPFKNAWAVIEPILSTVVSMINPITLAIAALTVGLGIAYAKNEEVRESFANATQAIKDGFQPSVEFITNTLFPDLQAGWERLKEILSPFTDFLNDTFVSIWQDMINPALTYIGNVVLPGLVSAFENLWNNVLVPLGEFLSSVFTPVIQIISEVLSMFWENVIIPLADAIGSILATAFEGLISIWNETLIPILNIVIEVFQFLWNNVLSPIVNFLWERFKPIFENVFNIIKGLIDGLSTAFSGLINFIVGVFTLNWEKAWNGIKDIFKGIFNSLISIAEGAINHIINGINGFINGFNGVVTKIGAVIGLDIEIPNIPSVSLPRFSTGGFPEDGLFLANHNELVGQFSNGKTAVANNEQITDGIKQGVKEAVAEMLAPYLAEIAQNTRETADKDFDISLDGRSLLDGLKQRSSRSGYSFT